MGAPDAGPAGTDVWVRALLASGGSGQFLLIRASFATSATGVRKIGQNPQDGKVRIYLCNADDQPVPVNRCRARRSTGGRGVVQENLRHRAKRRKFHGGVMSATTAGIRIFQLADLQPKNPNLTVVA